MTQLGSLQRSPDTLAVFRGPTSKWRGGDLEEEERKPVGEGGSLSFALEEKRQVGAYGYVDSQHADAAVSL